jgi:hypothetical protein
LLLAEISFHFSRTFSYADVLYFLFSFCSAMQREELASVFVRSADKLGHVPPNAFEKVACLVRNVINQRFMTYLSQAELRPSLFVSFTSFAYHCTMSLTADRT